MRFKLGDDLCRSDAILEEISFDELITALQSNCRCIAPETIRETYMSIQKIRQHDAMAVLLNNIDEIMEASK